MSEYKINPMNVLVYEEVKMEEKTASGIFMPSIVKVTSMRGKIALVGEGTPDSPMVWKEGDTVLFNPHAGQKFEWQGKEVRLLKANEIFIGGPSSL